MAISDIFPPGSPSPCKAGRKTASDFSRNDTAEPCPGQEERFSDMIRRSLSANLHHDSFAGLQRAFNPNIALLLPRGQRLDDLPRHCPVQEVSKRRSADLWSSCCLLPCWLCSYVPSCWKSPSSPSSWSSLHSAHPCQQLAELFPLRGHCGAYHSNAKKINYFIMLHIRWH